MTGKRYYSVDYDEQYYIFDSDVIRKGRVEEEAEYSYDIFAYSMSSDEIVDKLNELTNENEQLKKEIKYLQSELHNATYDVRKMTLKEVKDEIEKLERWE